MKRFEYTVCIKKTVTVYADTIQEVIEWACMEPINSEDCEIIDTQPTETETHADK